ncbi:MAG TPA: HAD family hydrolase [Desulfobulbus sp.]|nr:HAD family hydrolase [Desulfobulbus sp.]
MTLAVFDLDNTLLSGDSDYGWGKFLVDRNLVDREMYNQANEKFYQDYKQGILDIYEYSAFSFRPLADRSMEELKQLHRQFMHEVVRPMMGDKAMNLVEKHRRQGHVLLVITATNSFITRPIVQAFGIDHLLATDPKIINGRYSTEIDGIPCYKEGKVQRLEKWLQDTNQTLDDSWFYTDSINDRTLLEKVTHPVAVDPDDKLLALARRQGWQVMSLRS